MRLTAVVHRRGGGRGVYTYMAAGTSCCGWRSEVDSPLTAAVVSGSNNIVSPGQSEGVWFGGGNESDEEVGVGATPLAAEEPDRFYYPATTRTTTTTVLA